MISRVMAWITYNYVLDSHGPDSKQSIIEFITKLNDVHASLFSTGNAVILFKVKSVSNGLHIPRLRSPQDCSNNTEWRTSLFIILNGNQYSVPELYALSVLLISCAHLFKRTERIQHMLFVRSQPFFFFAGE
jgi:hypothetical protein